MDSEIWLDVPDGLFNQNLTYLTVSLIFLIFYIIKFTKIQRETSGSLEEWWLSSELPARIPTKRIMLCQPRWQMPEIFDYRQVKRINSYLCLPSVSLNWESHSFVLEQDFNVWAICVSYECELLLIYTHSYFLPKSKLFQNTMSAAPFLLLHSEKKESNPMSTGSFYPVN